MSVTRQALRDMILAEAGEAELANPDPFRGLPGPLLATLQALYPEDATLSYEQKQERVRQKLATAKFVTDLAALTGMDDMAIQLFVPALVNIDKEDLATLGNDIKALAESGQLTTTRLRQLISEIAGPPGHDTTLMTVGQFRKVVSEALDFDPGYREIAEGLLGAGFTDDVFVPIMGLYQDTGAVGVSGFEEWLLDEGDRMSDTFKEAFNRRPQDVSKLYVAYVTDYSRSGWDERLSGMREWLETVDPDSTDLGRDSLVVTGARLRGPMDESTLMTVGQFRRLVREAAAWSREQAADYSADLADRIAELPDGEGKTKLAADLALAGEPDDFDAINVELMEFEQAEEEAWTNRDPHPSEEQYQTDNVREDGNYLLNDLLAKFSASKILKGLRDDVYIDDHKKAFIKWLTDDDRPVGEDQEELLRDWLNHIGPHEAFEDLDLLSRTLLPSSLSERIDKTISKFVV